MKTIFKLIIFLNCIFLSYGLFAGPRGSSLLKLRMKGLPSMFNFEDGQLNGWEIDPNGTSGISSCTNIFVSAIRSFNGSYSMAVEINCSQKAPDGKLGGKVRFIVPDHGDLSGKTRYILHFSLQQISGTWGSDWLGVVLFFFRKNGSNWDGIWGWSNGGNGWAPPSTSWTTITWNISSEIPRDYIGEVGFELRGGQFSTGKAILYIDMIEFQ